MSISVVLHNAAAWVSDAEAVPHALGPCVFKSEGGWTREATEATSFLAWELGAEPLNAWKYEGMGAELRRAKMFDALTLAGIVAEEKENA